MSRRKLTAKAREHARFVLKHSSLAELDPKIETLVSKIDPEYRESIEAALSGPKLLAVARAAREKRRKGRPSRPDKHTILDQAAKIKAAGGYYTSLAPRFKMTPKQLTDLVTRKGANRSYFKRKVEEFRRSKVAS